MMNEHTKLGIAQIIFYVPAVSSIIYLNVRHGFQRSRGWFFLLVFSMMRLAGGILLVVLQQDPSNVGLVIASSILLGVGVPPLMFATMRFIATACATGFDDLPLLHRILTGGRILFFIVLGLLIVGGTLEGFDNLISIGRNVLQAAYIILAVLVAFMAILNIYLWGNQGKLTISGTTILKGTSAAIPFLVVRIAYAFLSVFHPDDLTWQPLYGSVGAFVGMALVQEYAILVIYFIVGIRTPYSRNIKNLRSATPSATFPEHLRGAEEQIVVSQK